MHAYIVHTCTLILKAVVMQATCQVYVMQVPHKTKLGISGSEPCPLQRKNRQWAITHFLEGRD